MSSFSDDFLSELKETVATDVAAEEARLKAERAARAAAEADAARQAEEAHRAAMQARLEAESRRRVLMTEARHSPAREAGAEPVIPHSSPSGARPAAAPGVVYAQAPQPERHGAGFYFVVMGLPMLCITAIVVSWLMKNPTQGPLVAPPTHQVAAPAVIPRVADPGDVAEAPTRTVSADADEVAEVEPDEKPAAAPVAKTEKKERPKRVKPPKRTGPKVAKEAKPPQKRTPGRIQGKLNLGDLGMDQLEGTGK